MGKKEKNLKTILESTKRVTEKTTPYLNYDLVEQSEFAAEVDRIYRALGGILPTFPVGFRGWDIEFDGIGVELDEQLHFNRYRAVTLTSEIYSKLPRFPLNNYLRYCKEFESDCLRSGKYRGKWTNNSCEKQFGQAGSYGNLTGNGSPRWKQRAFYDFVKDLSPLIIGVPVARIAIWDKYGKEDKSVNQSLSTKNIEYMDELISLVRAKTFQ